MPYARLALVFVLFLSNMIYVSSVEANNLVSLTEIHFEQAQDPSNLNLASISVKIPKSMPILNEDIGNEPALIDVTGQFRIGESRHFIVLAYAFSSFIKLPSRCTYQLTIIAYDFTTHSNLEIIIVRSRTEDRVRIASDRNGEPHLLQISKFSVSTAFEKSPLYPHFSARQSDLVDILHRTFWSSVLNNRGHLSSRGDQSCHSKLRVSGKSNL